MADFINSKKHLLKISIIYAICAISNLHNVHANEVNPQISEKTRAEWGKLWIELDKDPESIIMSCYLQVSNKTYEAMRESIVNEDNFDRLYLSSKGAYGIAEFAISSCNRLLGELNYFDDDNAGYQKAENILMHIADEMMSGYLKECSSEACVQFKAYMP